MFKLTKMSLERVLSPKLLYKVRSLKRILFDEPPLPPFVAVAAQGRRPQPVPPLESCLTTSGMPRPPGGPRILQDVAIEKYTNHQISAPYLFYTEEDVLILPAKEIARALTLGVSYVNSAAVEGDIAEFGTMGGFSARTLATAMVFDPQVQPITATNPLRQLHLFDSFEGLPEITSTVDLASPHVVSGAWSKGGCKVLGARELRSMVEGILPPERVCLHEGWFADTVKKLPSNTRFALVHFDGDLYSSTMDALGPCFERGFIAPGAVFCFDDWNCNHSDPAYGERRAWLELVGRHQISFSTCGDYSVGGTKLIVHSYIGMPGSK